jgi:hypothetical protein
MEHPSEFLADPHGMRHIAQPAFVASIPVTAATAFCDIATDISSAIEQNLPESV